MFRKRKSERERAEVEQKGIPSAVFGEEFEWTDEKLKIALSSYPDFKRLKSEAVLKMMLALNMYWDDVTKKWEVMSSTEIATVRNQARYYSAPPAALTTDQWANMRIDNNQRLIVVDEGALTVLNKLQFDGSNNLKCKYAL
ncbi:MAG: hypothetical protein ACFE9S_19095 [Candidatus Hermodarchaeota archaeon]